MRLVHAAASLACTGMRESSSVLWDGEFSSAVWDRGALITMLLGLTGWVLPPSRMPAAGTSAPEPDSTWPLAQPSSCTFGGYLGKGREGGARQSLLPIRWLEDSGATGGGSGGRGGPVIARR